MICAYDKVYLDCAKRVLGRMLDFAVHDLKYGIQEFFSLFIKSGIAERFGKGDYTILAGKSGVEVAYEVLEKMQIDVERTAPKYVVNRSEEYWTGWALAHYQWETALSFEEIEKFIPIHYVKALYSPYHEMDIKHFNRVDAYGPVAWCSMEFRCMGSFLCGIFSGRKALFIKAS